MNTQEKMAVAYYELNKILWDICFDFDNGDSCYESFIYDLIEKYESKLNELKRKNLSNVLCNKKKLANTFNNAKTQKVKRK